MNEYPRSYGQYTLAAIERLSDSELHHHAHPAMIRDLCRRVKELEKLPPIDLTQLPAYIELQKRLALAEAKLEAVRKYAEGEADGVGDASCVAGAVLSLLDDQ